MPLLTLLSIFLIFSFLPIQVFCFCDQSDEEAALSLRKNYKKIILPMYQELFHKLTPEAYPVGEVASTYTKIRGTGAWEIKSSNLKHDLDEGLASAIATALLNQTSATNFGAGRGHYETIVLDIFSKHLPIPRLRSFDGAPEIAKVTKGRVKYFDLTNTTSFVGLADYVFSFGVLEHIPPQYQDIAMETLLSHAKKGIVVSWAPPSQPGYGHFNMKRRSEVISLFRENELDYYPEVTKFFRAHGILLQFRRNVIAFCHKLKEPAIFPLYKPPQQSHQLLHRFRQNPSQQQQQQQRQQQQLRPHATRWELVFSCLFFFCFFFCFFLFFFHKKKVSRHLRFFTRIFY